MTTKNSPLRVLKSQADTIAMRLKAFERGETIEPQYVEKLRAARDEPSVKIGIVMDDKIITLDIPWETIRTTSEVGMAEYLLKQMRESRDAVN